MVTQSQPLRSYDAAATAVGWRWHAAQPERDGDPYGVRGTDAQMGSLLDRLHLVESPDDRDKLVRDLAGAGGPRTVAFLNQHGFNLAYTDPALRTALVQSDVLLRDGVGLEVALKLMRRACGLNCNGTDLIPEMLAGMAGRSVAIFGTREPWLGRAAAAVAALGLDVVVTRHGFSDDARYLADIETHRPDIVLLGMGMPRQELLAVELKARLGQSCLIVSGGAILDFLGQRFPRAPFWLRRMRLEWLFRLTREPRRLVGRYVLGGATFAFRVLRTRQAMPRPT